MEILSPPTFEPIEVEVVPTFTETLDEQIPRMAWMYLAVMGWGMSEEVH
jgi:hypothetical protein